MKIILNGKDTEFKDSSTIQDVVDSMNLPKFFVIEHNKTVIYKENYNTVLNDGDEIELVTFTGGG